MEMDQTIFSLALHFPVCLYHFLKMGKPADNDDTVGQLG